MADLVTKGRENCRNLDQTPYSDETLRQLLLGMLSAEQRDSIEDGFAADDELFDRLNDVEEELLEAYARGELTDEDSKRLESGLLMVPRNRERVQMLRTMKVAFERRVENPRSRSASWFGHPLWRIAFGVAALLLVVGIGWWLLRGPGQRNSIQVKGPGAPINAPPPAPNGTSGNDRPSSPNSPGTVNINTEPTPTPTPPTVYATLLLLPGGTRSGGGLSQLNLRANVTNVQVKLTLETSDYAKYRAMIYDENGGRVWQSGILSDRDLIVTLYFPRRILRDGDYRIGLDGIADDVKTPVANYSFRVKSR